MKAGAGTHNTFRDHYSNGHESPRNGDRKWHAAVVELYEDGGREAHRVLKENGVFVVKCQDEVSANRQNLTHVEIINSYSDTGFLLQGLVRRGPPEQTRHEPGAETSSREKESFVFSGVHQDSERLLRFDSECSPTRFGLHPMTAWRSAVAIQVRT